MMQRQDTVESSWISQAHYTICEDMRHWDDLEVDTDKVKMDCWHILRVVEKLWDKLQEEKK